MKKQFIALFLVLFLLAGCIEPPAPPGPSGSAKAKWVIMVYLDSDNNLEPLAVGDFDKMEAAGSNEDVIILVQWDRTPGFDESNGDWTGTKRFMITEGSQEGVVESKELLDLGEVDMGDASSLADFIKWVKENYPSERYALSLWDHAGGWTPHTQDDTSGTEMKMQDIAIALENAGFSEQNKLDLIIFNQCLMGQIDVAYSIAPHVKTMVASEEVIPGPGVAYTIPLQNLKQNPSMDEKQLAVEMVNAYEKFYTEEIFIPFTTFAAYDLSKMDEVNESASAFTSVLRKNVQQHWPAIGRSIVFSEVFADYEGIVTMKAFSTYDLVDFADLVRQEIGDEELGESATALKNAVQEMLLVEYHGSQHPFSYGLTMYFPEDEILYQEDYANSSDFASASGWNDFLLEYIAAEKTDTIAPEIIIDSVSSTTTNMDNPLNIKGTAEGNNIVSLYRVIGTVQNNTILMINNHALTQSYREYEGERELPEFFDGTNNIDFTWAPMTEIITNGEEAVIAPLYPTGINDYYFYASGEYKSVAEQQPFEARLLFDYRTGALLQATRFTEVGSELVPSDFVPQKEDFFTPYYEMQNLLTGEYGITKGSGISFGENGIWTDLTILNEGQYIVGLLVKDISGNTAFNFAEVDVAGQPHPNPNTTASDLLGKWVGAKLGFEISKDGTCVSTRGLGKSDCAYWFRNNNGISIVSFYIFAESEEEPVFVSFMVDLQENMLYLTEMFEGGKYTLWKEGTTPVENPIEQIDNALIGKWVNQLGSIEFKQDGSYIWIVNEKTVVGTFSTSNETLYFSNNGKTAYTYSVFGNSLEIVDSSGTKLSLTKYAVKILPSNPLAGRWYNAMMNETAIFNDDWTYQSYLSGALFANGTYSISGNALILQTTYGKFYYIFTIGGNILTLYDQIYGTYASYVKAS